MAETKVPELYKSPNPNPKVSKRVTESRRTRRFVFAVVEPQLLEEDESQDRLRKKPDPSRQKSFVKRQRAASLEGAKEDESDRVLAEGSVEDARLHHVEGLREDGGRGAGEAR